VSSFIVRFVDISGIDDHHCLHFLFISLYFIYLCLGLCCIR